MVNVVPLEKQFNQCIPYLDIVPEIGHLRTSITPYHGLKGAMEVKLRSKEADVPRMGIDAIVGRQHLNSMMSAKGVRILYPPEPYRKSPANEFYVFPYNMSPRMSPGTLLALVEADKLPQQTALFAESKSTEFDFATKREALANAALNFISAASYKGSDRRGIDHREIFTAADTFIKDYYSLKSQVARAPDTKDVLALMLAFTAVYDKLHDFLTSDRGRYFRTKNPYIDEFAEKKAVSVNGSEMLQREGRQLKRFMPLKEWQAVIDKWGLVTNRENSRKPDFAGKL